MEAMSRRGRKTFETKEKIMAATHELFETEGFAAITFRSLAAKSGISFGSIQHHYGTKDNLVFIYGCRRFEQFLEGHTVELPFTAQPDLHQADIIRRVTAYFRIYAAFARQMGKDFMLESSRNGHDIFRVVCFESCIVPLMEEGFSAKAFSTPVERRGQMEEDLIILCRSIVLLWSSSGDEWTFSGSLEEILTRVLCRFLYDSDSDA